MKRTLLLLFCLLFPLMLHAQQRLPFTVHKSQPENPGPTILVVGGIQGDEPGGFHAASLLVTNYRFRYGNVWVVPNLNFESIIKRSRGVHGDMNRKFAKLSESDPDRQEVERIKALITDPRVSMILNLHDGSGFYRTQWKDKLHNPYRWGQSAIIDQEQLEGTPHDNIGELARASAEQANQALLDDEHRYQVKNTRTREGDKEMEKTLTYYAINRGKAAVGIEASKELPTHERVYYHLQVIEGFLKQLGMEYQRDFELQPQLVKRVIDDNIKVAFYQNRILLDLADAREQLRYVPLKKTSEIEFTASNPLVAVLPKGKGYQVNYGNRRMTWLQPEYMGYDNSLKQMEIEVDRELQQVKPGSIIRVGKSFRVVPREGYRVNVIGWTRNGVRNEAGQDIELDTILKRYSVDRAGKVFRVEFYKGKEFSGMVLVRFDDSKDDTSPVARVERLYSPKPDTPKS